MLGGLIALMGAWAVLSLANLPPLDGPPPTKEAVGPLSVVAAVSVALFLFAAWRYCRLYRRRGQIVPLMVAVAFVLLAEAMIAIALSRNWHVSWWEWHVLMLTAFAAIALGARSEYRRSGSLSGAFGGLYLEATLARLDRWHAGAIAALAAADERGESSDRVLDELRAEGATSDEVKLLAEAARELRRLDESFRPYLPSVVAQRIRSGDGAAVASLGGEEREVTVLFADLASFTTFSETRTPTAGHRDAQRLLGCGGARHRCGGRRHRAVRGRWRHGDLQRRRRSDRPRSTGARAALAIIEAARPLADAHPDWPTFRVGVNTGPAVIGNVGVAGRLSFAAIGDTSNVAARLMSAGDPGQVVIAGTTWRALGPGEGRIFARPHPGEGQTRAGRSLGPAGRIVSRSRTDRRGSSPARSRPRSGATTQRGRASTWPTMSSAG